MSDREVGVVSELQLRIEAVFSQIDTDAAVAMCQAQFGGSTQLISSACACLGNIACVEGGIQSIAQGGMVATVQDAAARRDRSERSGLAAWHWRRRGH